MEEKNISEKESIALITEMISRTKRRYFGNGDILLMWGYITVAVSIAVGVLLIATHNQNWNWLWYLIPVIGGILTPIMAKKERKVAGVKNYSDIVLSRIWTAVGITGLVSILACLAFWFVASVDCWKIMLLFALLLVAFAEIVQGIVIKENCFIYGGSIGLAVGIVTGCCIAGGVPLGVFWYLPLFMLSFVAMMIIPGHVINHKVKHL